MGIDARMAVVLPNAPTNAEVLEMGWRLGASFGEILFHHKDEPCLSTYIHSWVSGLPTDGTAVILNLYGRYYGEGYERGQIHDYIAIAEWLETVYPGCQVFYGADYDDAYKPFGKEERTTLWKHFCKVGHSPD